MTAVQQVVIGVLLDDGGRGLARALAGLGVVVVLVLFVAVFIPVALLAGGGVPLARQTQQANGSHSAEPYSAVSVHLKEVPPPIGSGPVEIARRYMGVRYVFGGSDPVVGLDCSGLVQLVFRQLEISLPRTAQLQYQTTTRVALDQLQPGDLVFFARTYADPHDWITHVGIYAGAGQQINAPAEGQVVSIQPVFSGFWGAHYVAAGRVGGVPKPSVSPQLEGTHDE